MNILLQALEKSPEYQRLLDAISRGSACGSVRAEPDYRAAIFLLRCTQHLPAPLSFWRYRTSWRQAGCRKSWRAFSAVQIPILPERELTFVEASGVSRQWEQKRLKLLYDLAAGKLPLLIASFGAMALRTMPRAVLFSASILLRVGASFTPEDLIERLTQAGYSRTTLVEGVGQFALRGGILDVYSPGEAMPVRCEFFGDELDAMGFFDPTTQRRTENTDAGAAAAGGREPAVFAPGGRRRALPGSCRASLPGSGGARRPHENLITTLTRDIESLQSGVSFPPRTGIWR